MFTITRKPLTLMRIAKGVYCVGVYHPTTGKIVDYRVWGTRGSYEVAVVLEIGQAAKILGTVTTLAAGEQLINDHYNSL